MCDSEWYNRPNCFTCVLIRLTVLELGLVRNWAELGVKLELDHISN